jgi:Transposase DDE domain group 1
VPQDTSIPLTFASIAGKKVHVDFDGGTLTSDGGVLLLRAVEANIGIIQRLSQALHDRRHQSYVEHTYDDLLRQRVFQIACGYEDANDCDTLRHDPAFKAACNHLPISGKPLASQPTMTRLENAARRSDLYRMAQALVDTFLASYASEPEAILLDIDDTDAPTHGDQQLTLFNAHYGEHCYLPLHIYEGQSGKLITTILRPGKRPSGKEIVSILRRLVAYIRQHWPTVMMLVRGDSHFSTPEVHDFCDQRGLYFLLGQSTNDVLQAQAGPLVTHAQALYRYEKSRQLDPARPTKVRLLSSFAYQARSWRKPQRIVCKVEVSDQGPNIRFVVSNLHHPRPSVLYDMMYCDRGRMENFIKNHKTFLHSDRTSCHTFTANHLRLLLHSAAYVLLHALAEQGLQGTVWAKAQFNILQLRLLKVGAKVRELATKITFHFPTAFPLQAVYRQLVCQLAQGVPDHPT